MKIERMQINEVKDGWMFRGRKYKSAVRAQKAAGRYCRKNEIQVQIIDWITTTRIGSIVVKAITGEE